MTSSITRRSICILLSWVFVATAAVLISPSPVVADPIDALGSKTGEAALAIANFGSPISSAAGSGTASKSISSFGLPATVGTAVTLARQIVLEQTTISCDGDGDGFAAVDDAGQVTSFYQLVESTGVDTYGTIYYESTGIVLTRPPAGFRYQMWVCFESVDGVTHSQASLAEPQPVLARDAESWFNEAKDEAEAEVARKLWKPGWQIWPGQNSRQIVGLPSWLYITDEAWDITPTAKKSAGPDFTFTLADGSTKTDNEVLVSVTAKPFGSKWKFSDGPEFECAGRGNQWQPGLIEPTNDCGREWEHTTAGVDEVKLQAALVYDFEFSSNLQTAETLPYLNGRQFAGGGKVVAEYGDEVDLRVGEVQAYGSTEGAREQLAPPRSTPVQGEPIGDKCGGFFGGLRCAAITVISTYVSVVTFFIPFLDELISFVQGCAQAVAEFGQAVGDIVNDFILLASDPIAFVGEKWEEIQQIYQAVTSDPKQFAIDFVKATVEWDLLAAGEYAKWVGKMACSFVIDYISGNIAGRVLRKVKDLFRNGRTPDAPTRPDGDNPDIDNPDPDGPDAPDPDAPDPDNPDPNDPDPNDPDPNDPDPNDPDLECPLSSFPAGTLVLMGDGTHTAIELIRPGDYVISHKLDTGVWEPKLVLDQWSHPDRGPPATATLTDGSTITATDDHLFWVESTQTWTELQHVQPGDQLLTPNGTVTIDHITVGPAHPWTVWELTVTDNHNFTVAASTSDLLVHNAPEDPFDDPIFDVTDDWPTDPDGYRAEFEALPPSQRQALQDALERTLPEGSRVSQAASQEWFDRLTPGQVKVALAVPENTSDQTDMFRKRVSAALRDGGHHEFFPVREAALAKALGLRATDIAGFSLPTGEVGGTIPPGDRLRGDTDANWTHGGQGSKRYHEALYEALAELEPPVSAQAAQDAIKKVNETWGLTKHPDYPNWARILPWVRSPRCP